MIKVGIDVDDVLVPTGELLLKRANEEFGINKSLDDCVSYWLHENLGVSKDDIERFYRGQLKSGFLLTLEPDPTAIAVLESHSSVIEPYYITARGEELKDHTYQWFETSGLPYAKDKIYFTKDKAPLAKELGLQLFVEDHGQIAIDLAKQEIVVLLMKYKWNEFVRKPKFIEVIDPDAYIMPVDDWYDIHCFLQGFSKALESI